MTPRPKRVTIKDVAARAGVSPSAVSIALNGKGESLPEKTRERIRAAADELDYRPDYSARAMVTGKTHIVGIVLPDISNPFFAQLVGQIQTALAARGYDVHALQQRGKSGKRLAFYPFARGARRGRSDSGARFRVFDGGRSGEFTKGPCRSEASRSFSRPML